MDLVVLCTLPEHAVDWEQLRGRTCRVLSFADSATERELLLRCGSHGLHVDGVIRARERMDEVSTITRERYARFIARWPRNFMKRGRNFCERFTYRKEISLWWLSSASMKQNEVTSTFEYLCWVEIIRAVLHEGGFVRCVLLSDDPVVALIVTRCCDQVGVSVMTLCPLRSLKTRSVPYYAAARLGLIFQLVLKMIFFRMTLHEDGKVPSLSARFDNGKD